MFKRIFFHGLIASVLTAIAAVIYNHIYIFATEADFSKVINYGSIIGLSLAICVMSSNIYSELLHLVKMAGQNR